MIPARKRFGQHFLHDPAIIARIVQAVAPSRTAALVEIGPGRGALTGSLLAAAGRMDVIEIDRDLVAALRARFPSSAGLTVHVGDVLRFDWAGLAAQRAARLQLVGNLPYNISTPLLFRLLKQRAHFSVLHFMLQKEVVDRIVASPGSAHYGRLGIMLAPYFSTERVLDVGPGAFTPAPRVHSAVLCLRPRPEVPAWALTPSFARVVGAAFMQRRKILRNALSELLTAEAIEAAGLDPGGRAETLSPEEFGALALQADTVLH